jgi:hypothetical protein
MLSRLCLGHGIPDCATLAAEVAAWTVARNEQRATNRWTITLEDATTKLHRTTFYARRGTVPVGPPEHHHLCSPLPETCFSCLSLRRSILGGHFG